MTDFEDALKALVREDGASDALRKDEAVKVAKEWVQSRNEVPTGYRGWTQFGWLMNQLATRCVAESLKNAEDEWQLCDRLERADNILRNVWYAGAPEIATRWWKDDEKPSDAEQKIIDQAKATVWRRRDPKQSFQEGFKSKHYTAFDQQDFNSTVADYLEKPWLQHPFLDWVMVDMMVSRELSAFGEELKINFMPGPRGLFGAHARYFTSGGNLVKMKMPNWESLWKKALLILFPIGLIYSAFHSDYNGLGAGLLALCSAAIAL